MTQMRNAFGDIVEELGKAITQNEDVRKAVEGVTKVFRLLEKAVTENRDRIGSFVSRALAGLVQMLGFMVSVIGDAVKSWSLFKGTLMETAIAFAEFEVWLNRTTGSEWLEENERRLKSLRQMTREQASNAREAEEFAAKAANVATQIGGISTSLDDLASGFSLREGFAFKVDLLFPEMDEIQKQFGGGGKFGAALEDRDAGHIVCLGSYHQADGR